MFEDEISDDALVDKVGRGDQQAAAVLVRRHSQRVLNISRRMLNSEVDAEDTVQDVFLKVWKSAHKWKAGKAKFTTWLHRVTVNACLDKLRKPSMGDIESVPEVNDETATPAEQMEANARTDTLLKSMGSLPDRQLAALTLCYFEEMSNIEAAEIMEVSVDAIESLLSRGRRKLRELLAHEREDLLIQTPRGQSSGF